MTIGRAVVAVHPQHRRAARGGDHQDGVRPARALRLLHRRVGGAVAVAEPGRAARLLRRPGRRDRARRQGHVPARRHPQRRRPRPALPDREEPRVPALQHVPRQRAERRGRARDQPDVGRALRRRVPRHRGHAAVPARQRVAADRAVAGAEPEDPARQGPRRPRRPRASRRPARSDRADRVRRSRQPARDRAAELRREPDAEPRRCCARDDSDRRRRSPAAVDEVGRILRADGADLLLVEANPKTARVHLRLVLDTVGCEECVLPPDMFRETINDSLQRRIVGEFELVLDDPRRASRAVPARARPTTTSSSTRGARSWRCTSRCCTTSCARSKTTPASTPACSPRSRTSRAPSRPGRLRLSELHELMHPRYSQPGLSRLVQRMEADGLVERRRRSRRRPGRGARDDPGRPGPLHPGRRGVHGGAARALRAASLGRAGARARGRARARCARTRDSRRRVAYGSHWMIKYIGSKRRLVPVLGELASAVGARRALDLFTGTTRVAQELQAARACT